MIENNLSYIEQTNISNRKISIFHLEHFGGIAQAITLRARLHPDDYAVLVIGDWGGVARYEISNKLVLNGVFDKCIFYKLNYFLKMDNESFIEEKICHFFDNEFKDLNLDNINKIYTSGDMGNTFAIWLSIRNMQYYYYDLAPIYVNRKIIDQAFLHKLCSNEYNLVMNKHKALGGFSNLCVGYMVFKESIDNNYIDVSKIIRYDFNKELLLIKDSFKKQIVRAFEVVEIEDNSQLVLTNSGGMFLTSGLSKSKIPLLMHYILDFTKNLTNPIIKPHPFDPIDYQSFNNIQILERNFPIELLSMTGDSRKLIECVGVSTSSIAKLDLKESCEIVKWGGFFYRNFAQIPILYAVAQMISMIKNTTSYHAIVDYFSWLKDFYKCSKYNISEIIWAKANAIGNVVLFVDRSDTNVKNNIKIGLQSAHNDAIICFLNMKTQLTDYDIPINILNKIIPVKINVYADEGSLDTSREHTVYFFTKNPEIRKKIQSFSMSEYFKYSKIKVTVDPNSNLQSQIDFLKFTIDVLYKHIQNV